MQTSPREEVSAKTCVPCTQVITAEIIFLLKNWFNLLSGAPYIDANTEIAITPSKKVIIIHYH